MRASQVYSTSSAWIQRLKSLPFFVFFALVLYLYCSILLDGSLWSPSHPSLRASTSSSSSTSIVASALTLKPSKPLIMQGRAVVPSIIYGTAWKKERTAELVEQAVRAGFRAIDTACQPKHYQEKGVGDALQRLYAAGVVRREDIFLQTKFTSLNGQDPRSIPYDRHAPLVQQIQQSFAKSCANLQTVYLDSLLLHSPMDTLDDTLTAWRTLEDIYRQGGVRHIGLSNTYNLQMLQRIYEAAEVKPSFLQNRFYQQSGYDNAVRKYCQEHNIIYQSFWTLTGNPHIVQSAVVAVLAAKYGRTPVQVMYKYVQALGIVPLDGTTSAQHMAEDLDLDSFSLLPEEVEKVSALLGPA